MATLILPLCLQCPRGGRYFICDNCHYIVPELVPNPTSENGSGFDYVCPVCGPEVDVMEMYMERMISVDNPLSGGRILTFDCEHCCRHPKVWEIIEALWEITSLECGRAGCCWVLLKPADLSRYDIEDEVIEGRVYALLESPH